jgi:hypothetical protein
MDNKVRSIDISFTAITEFRISDAFSEEDPEEWYYERVHFYDLTNHNLMKRAFDDIIKDRPGLTKHFKKEDILGEYKDGKKYIRYYVDNIQSGVILITAFEEVGLVVDNANFVYNLKNRKYKENPK